MSTTPESFTAALSKFFLGDGETSENAEATHSRNLARLLTYFGAGETPVYDGSRFEFYAAAETDPDRITAADLVAITLLSMEIRRNSGSGITTAHVRALEERSSEVRHLLAQIPADRDLHELSAQEYKKLIGEGSFGERLWALLRDQIGMYRVATFKVMARKRPRLFPIADSRTHEILGTPPNWWESWYEALRDGDRAIVTELETLRKDAARKVPSIGNVSLLRVADIALWLEKNGTAADDQG